MSLSPAIFLTIAMLVLGKFFALGKILPVNSGVA